MRDGDCTTMTDPKAEEMDQYPGWNPDSVASRGMDPILGDTPLTLQHPALQSYLLNRVFKMVVRVTVCNMGGSSYLLITI